MSYDIFCQSVQGASHIKNDMPCEDSGKIHVTDFCKIFVLGDGHGDSNCPRSKIGSQYICDITVQSLEKFAFDIESLGWEEKLFNKAETQTLMNQLITSIFGKWSCAVNDEFIQNPLTDKESEAANEYIERYRKGERIEHIYGTTLIAGLLEHLAPDCGTIAAVPAKDTVKRVNDNGLVQETLLRSELWNIQTPQCFYTEPIRRCYLQGQQDGYAATDDASLAERYGLAVKVVPAYYENIKLTTPEDLDVAEVFLKRLNLV